MSTARSNQFMKDNNFYSFSMCFKLLEEAEEALSENLSPAEYQNIMYSCRSDQTRLIFIIDIDLARDSSTNKIRSQLYEAAHLFKRQGGEIYVYSAHSLDIFKDGNVHAFTKITYDLTTSTQAKADLISRNINPGNDVCSFFIFGDNMANYLQQKFHKVEMCINVIGTNFLTFNHNVMPLTKYTTVEYLLFYLGINLRMNKTIFNETGN
jgi:hypothetical protein